MSGDLMMFVAGTVGFNIGVLVGWWLRKQVGKYSK